MKGMKKLKWNKRNSNTSSKCKNTLFLFPKMIKGNELSENLKKGKTFSFSFFLFILNK